MSMYGKATQRQKEQPRVKPHVKKGDTVLVLSGKDRGKQARVLRVIASKGTAIVERVNFIRKHTRPNPQKNVKGGIAEREAPIKVSKLQVVCPSCNKPSRTGTHRTEDGGARFCKSCQAEIGK
jgi:large subunit ribosomal protein L24